MQTWKSLGKYGGSLNPTVEILHHAAQFVAMVGNSYLPRLPDDSQNNLNWNGDHNRLEGRWIEDPKVRLSLDVAQFELVLEKDERSNRLALDGRTKEQVIANLRALLGECGVDPALLHPISHYAIPNHALDAGVPFQKPQNEILQEWANWRNNTQYVLETIKPSLSWASEPRIWPHHFDTGLYIPTTRDEDGKDIQSIGLGLAIADAYVSEPYFYINHWSNRPLDYPAADPAIRSGYWHSKDWKGFTLPSSAFHSYSSSQQEKIVKEFFQDGVNATLFLMGKLPKTVFAE